MSGRNYKTDSTESTKKKRAPLSKRLQATKAGYISAHGASVKDVTDRSEMTYGGQEQARRAIRADGKSRPEKARPSPRPSGRQTNRCPTAS